MAQINNSDTIKSLISKAGIQTSIDNVPTQLAEKIVPVICCDPKRDIRVLVGTASDSVSSLILTTSTTKRTFVIGTSITTAKDVNSTSLFTDIVATNIFGEGIRLNRTRYEPLTAMSHITNDLIYPLPIELAKNSTVTITNSTNVASIDSSGMVFYYEVEDKNN